MADHVVNPSTKFEGPTVICPWHCVNEGSRSLSTLLQIINYASIVLVVLLCLFFECIRCVFRLLSSKFYLIFIIPALCSCVTVFYRSLSVFVFTAFAGDY